MERIVVWQRTVPATRDELDAPAERSAWTTHVAATMEAAGAEVLSVIGSAVVAAFDAPDIEAAVITSASLAQEADRREPRRLATFGVAAGELGEVTAGESRFIAGGAIDRAQLLSSRVKPGEVVFDPTAHEMAAETFLFTRELRGGVLSPPGYVLDLRHPRRADCRRAIRLLQPPPMPPGVRQTLAEVLAAARGKRHARVLLRGGMSAGGQEWINALIAECRPPLLLQLKSVLGALEPLGSLRYALIRNWSHTDALAAALDARGVDYTSIGTLSRVVEGKPVQRLEAVSAVRELLSAYQEETQRPFVVVDPVTGVDPVSLWTVLEATGDEVPSFVITRLPEETRPPMPLIQGGAPLEVTIPALKDADAVFVAKAILGGLTEDDVALRLATMGGHAPTTLVETARALVAAGDLIHDGQRFVWRTKPRLRSQAIAIESLIEERLAGLDADAHRLLEIVASCPSGTSEEQIRKVCELDGITAGSYKAALAILVDEQLAISEGALRPSSSALRSVTLQMMPPARSSELFRFIAETMKASLSEAQAFAWATVGTYLVEGGHVEDGAMALLVAGEAAGAHDFMSAAVRLAAAAVHAHPDPSVRRAAAKLTKATFGQTMAERKPRTSRTSETPTIPPAQVASDSLSRKVVKALADRNLEECERYLDIAVAEGHDRGVADRVRALSRLAAGDVPSAMQALGRLRERQEHTLGPRDVLTHAAALMAVGHLDDAIRRALQGLALSRKAGHDKGEQAARCLIAACYLALGREHDARAVNATTAARDVANVAP